MRWLMVVAVVAGTMGAGRTTKPTTAPSLIDTTPLRAKVDAAEESLAKAKADARRQWESSAEYLRLKKDLDDKRTARDNAKAGSDLQAKLDASKAYNDARIKFEAADAKGESGTELAEASRARDGAARELADAERENARRQADADARDPIKTGIKNHRLAIGMTRAEAITALEGDRDFVPKPEVISETADEQVVRYSFYHYIDNADFSMTTEWEHLATYRGGKIVAIDRGEPRTRQRAKPRPIGR